MIKNPNFYSISDNQPEIGQSIIYIGVRNSEYARLRKLTHPENDMIFIGKYLGNNKAEYHEGFSEYTVVYWYPLPEFSFEEV